jgi:hypothetical protein
VGRRAGVIAQGTADTTVRKSPSNSARPLCEQRTPVSFIELKGVNHTFAAKNSVGAPLDGRALQRRARAVRLRSLAIGSQAQNTS